MQYSSVSAKAISFHKHGTVLSLVEESALNAKKFDIDEHIIQLWLSTPCNYSHTLPLT